MEILFATNNKHKLEEIKALLKEQTIKIMSLSEANIYDTIPEPYDKIEDNAVHKAMFIYKKYKINCFADDTGLEVEALNGNPGVLSARYAGKNCNFNDNMNKLLSEMIYEKHRKAVFRTIIALIINNQVHVFEGILTGKISKEKIGVEGFGYDPVFIPDGLNKTLAEISFEEKNRISHRALATNKLVKYLSTLNSLINQ